MFAMMSDQEAPDSVTVSGPLSRLREAMARYLRSHALHCYPGPQYIWSSEHRLWMESRPMGHFIQLKESKMLFHWYSKWVDILKSGMKLRLMRSCQNRGEGCWLLCWLSRGRGYQLCDDDVCTGIPQLKGGCIIAPALMIHRQFPAG